MDRSLGRPKDDSSMLDRVVGIEQLAANGPFESSNRNPSRRQDMSVERLRRARDGLILWEGS
jgi:hypothetical protein